MKDLMRGAPFAFSELFGAIDGINVPGAFTVRFKKGEEISEFQRGVDCVGLIISGAVGVKAGEVGSVSVLKRGAEFGICNIYVRDPMPTRLSARTDSEVLFIPKSEFTRLLDSDPGLRERYIRLCNEKMIYLAKRLKILSTPSAEERVMVWLRGEAVGGVVKLKLPKDEIAKMLCVSRASFFRSISALIGSGRILPIPGGYRLTEETV